MTTTIRKNEYLFIYPDFFSENCLPWQSNVDKQTHRQTMCLALKNIYCLSSRKKLRKIKNKYQFIYFKFLYSAVSFF